MNDSSDISNNSGPGSAAEPSMEEILASIRRILKEDEGTLPSGDVEDEDILVLDASMIASPADISSATAPPVDTGLIEAHEAPVTHYHEPMHFSSEPALDTHDFETGSPAAAQDQVTLAPAPAAHEEEYAMEEQVQSPEGLMSEDTTSQVSSTIGSLVRSISNERSVAVSRGGMTIEDIVREEIRPVLKAWLDTHLPSLVERIVRAEIGRVIDRSQV